MSFVFIFFNKPSTIFNILFVFATTPMQYRCVLWLQVSNQILTMDKQYYISTFLKGTYKTYKFKYIFFFSIESK